MDIGAPLDWDVAVRTGVRVAPPPPRLEPGAATALQRELSRSAEHSRELAAHTSRLPAAPHADTLVIDRPGWIRANVETFAHLLEQPAPRQGVARLPQVVRGTAAGAEIGAVLGWLSGRVLGQFDPWANRLVLVAPNIHQVQQRLGVDPKDFQLWVCVHEETHRLQFTAAPWLIDHLTALATDLMRDLNVDTSLVGQLARGVRKGEAPSLIDAIRADRASAQLLDRATATMSLLEGHADVMMDRVGTREIPTVRQIRRRFNTRRDATGPAKWISGLLGLDAKMAQYATGAAFCRGVIAEIGVPGLNEVWADPQHLPTVTELADPSSWVARICRPAAS